jgi:hypothetical protein
MRIDHGVEMNQEVRENVIKNQVQSVYDEMMRQMIKEDGVVCAEKESERGR